MARPSHLRIKKYKAKINADVVAQRISDYKDIMVEQQETRQAELVDVENTVKNILHGTDEPTWKFPFYLSYARKLYGIKKKYSDKTMNNEGKLAKATWTTRGLNATILISIADNLGFDTSSW